MNHLAIDIGASSGRHIVGSMENGRLCTKEVYRFKNGPLQKDGHLVWDTKMLLAEVKKGIDTALEQFGQIETLSVDTWGVDYVLMKGDRELYPVYAYRDERGKAASARVHQLISFHELYEATGIQYQPFNSIYQLYADKEAGRLEGVTDWLMIPEYLLYKLCGVKVREYTNATTSGLVNSESREFDTDIIGKLGLPAQLFPKLTKPGTVLGEYQGIKVVACATHDTASAVEGIPMDRNDLYISSGTWSLLGIRSGIPHTDPGSEKANYSNEGGVGYIRYQKNIMGLWVINRLQEELCPELSVEELMKEAEKSTFTETVDINDARLLSPKNMTKTYGELLGHTPENRFDYFGSAYRSLAKSYDEAIKELEKNTGSSHERLFIVGGGAKNAFLNRLAEEYTEKKVVALPIEATALGNLKIQMEAVNGTD